MEDSYISPLGTAVLSLQVHDIQDALDILPMPNIVIIDQTTDTSIGPDTELDSIVDQSISRRGDKRKRDDLSYLTPTKTAVTTTTTTGVVTCQSMQTLTVPDRVLDSLDHPPFEPRFIFARKSLDLGKK